MKKINLLLLFLLLACALPAQDGIFSIFVYLSEILWIKPYGKDV
jgi:hypothetical protein